MENTAVLTETAQTEPNISGAPTDAAQTPASTTGAPPANDGDNEHPEDGHGREGGYQRVRRQREEARQDAAHWRAEALRLAAAQPKPAEAAPAVVEEPEPKEEDFATVSEYLKAVRAWDKKQIVKEVQTLQTTTEKQREAEAQQNTRMTTYREKAAAFAAENPDFDNTMAATKIPVSPVMHEAITTSEVGPALAFYLATHEEEAESILNMSPGLAGRALGLIEARLAKDSPATEPANKPDLPLITGAPPTTNPVRKVSPTAKAVDPLDAKADQVTFEKEMNKRQFGK